MSVEHFLWSALCLYGTSPGVHYVCRTLPLECTMFVWHSPGVHYICRTLLLEYTMSVWHFPWSTLCLYDTSPGVVPAGSPPRGGDVGLNTILFKKGIYDKKKMSAIINNHKLI